MGNRGAFGNGQALTNALKYGILRIFKLSKSGLLVVLLEARNMLNELKNRAMRRLAQTTVGRRVTEIAEVLATHRLHTEARAAVRQLRDTPWLIYGITTGACGELVPMLWQPAGASANVLANRFSYAEQETEEFLGFKPEKFVSLDTACYMATAAYYQGRKLAVKRGKNEGHVMGVAMTSAVTTGRERKGADQAIIAVRTRTGLWTVTVLMKKPENFASDAEAHRIQQGNLADLLTLNAILAVAELRQVPLPVDRIERSEELDAESGTLRPTQVSLWSGSDKTRPMYGKVIMPDGSTREISSLDPKEWIIFSGSFNPVTYAHDEMAREIERATGKRVIFQITKAHPEKQVTDQDMIDRAGQFLYRWPVVLLEEHGLYVDKAELFPGFEFLIGADVVVERLFDQKYYDGYLGMMAAMQRLLDLKVVFHVNGRKCADGHYKELTDLPIPARFASMFRAFSRRNDVSSSERRAAGANV